MRTRIASFLALLLLPAACLAAVDGAQTFDSAYPGLLKGALASASFGPLPEGVLVQYRGGEVTLAELNDLLAKAPAERRADMERNSIFLAQELATKRLLLAAATDAAQKRGEKVEGVPESQLLGKHLQNVVADVTVSDAEVEAYYKAHPEMFNGKAFKKVKDQLQAFVRKQKRQEAATEYVRGLGAAYESILADTWARQAAVSAQDNPVDAARRTGRPSLLEFSGPECPPCEKMAPYVETLGKKYENRVNVITVWVPEYLVLCTRLGITSTPTQIYLNSKGAEINRHIGLLSEKDLEAQIVGLMAQ